MDKRLKKIIMFQLPIQYQILLEEYMLPHFDVFNFHEAATHSPEMEL
jgi:hypothetical protein